MGISRLTACALGPQVSEIAINLFFFILIFLRLFAFNGEFFYFIITKRSATTITGQEFFRLNHQMIA
jgi:hypothetical protein